MKTNIAYSIRKMFTIFFAFGLLLFSGAKKDSFAIVFFDGVPTVVEDRVSFDDLIAGWDFHLIAISNSGPTELTITTNKRTSKNMLQFVCGGNVIGSPAAFGFVNTMHGDINLSIYNTNLASLNVNFPCFVGGNYVAGHSTSYHHGNINLLLSNVNFTEENVILGPKTDQWGRAYLYGSLNLSATNVFGYTRLSDFDRGNVDCTGDINIEIKDSSFIGELFFCESTGTIGGNVDINVQNSSFGTLNLAREATVHGDLNFLADKVKINSLNIVGNAMLQGDIDILLTNSIINDIELGPQNLNQSTLKYVDFTIYNSCIVNLSVSPRINNNSSIENFNLDFLSGYIQNLNIGHYHGQVEEATVNIYDGAAIQTILIGNNGAGGFVEDLAINIYGGSIYNINCEVDTSSTINFFPGKTSHIVYNIGGTERIEEVFLHKNAFTKLGLPNDNVGIIVQKFYFAGNVIIPHNTSFGLDLNDSLVTDGGTIFPEHHLPYLENTLFMLSGNPEVTIIKPLEVNLSLSPRLIGQQNLVLAEIEEDTPGLFAIHNYSGLLWSDTHYDPTTKTYYLNNIRPSEAYYAYSSAREASNWLRGMHISSVQGRLRTTVTQKEAGFWVNVQGGREKLDSAVGSSKMPWLMANIGYDNLSTVSSLKTIFGFSFGANKGNHKWKSAHTAKNDIFMGMINGYAGISHQSGIYSGVAAQFSIARIKTKNPGLKSNKNWTEYVPSGAIELGWNYSLANGIKINPRTQISIEQLSKHDFKLSQDAGFDVATLKKSFIVSSMLGIAGTYETQVVSSIPLGIEASVDWIKGIGGDFASHSKILNMTFKDKNDTDTIRTSLGVYTQINESMMLKINSFIDVGDDKGFGGQISATYTF